MKAIINRKQIVTIQKYKRWAQLDDPTYRDLLDRAAGVRSSKLLDQGNFDRVMAWLEALLFDSVGAGIVAAPTGVIRTYWRDKLPTEGMINSRLRYTMERWWTLLVDYLPEEQLLEVKNLPEFAGILSLDKWTGNANGRQAVFTRKQRERRYKAVFIDFGDCFHAGDWRFEDAPLRGVYYRNDVYRGITGWESFEPWLTRMETLPAETVWAAANDVPPEWYGGDMGELEGLVEKLLVRRSRIRDLIDEFRRSNRVPFPKWGEGVGKIEEGGWKEDWKGSRIGRVN